MHCLEQHSVLSSLSLEVKALQYFVSSRGLLLDKKTLVKIWLNPGLNLVYMALVYILSKAFSRLICSILFWVSNRQIVDNKN